MDKNGWASISLKMLSVDRRQMAGHNDHLTHINLNSSYHQIVDFIDWIVNENNSEQDILEIHRSAEEV